MRESSLNRQPDTYLLLQVGSQQQRATALALPPPGQLELFAIADVPRDLTLSTDSCNSPRRSKPALLRSILQAGVSFIHAGSCPRQQRICKGQRATTSYVRPVELGDRRPRWGNREKIKGDRSQRTVVKRTREQQQQEESSPRLLADLSPFSTHSYFPVIQQPTLRRASCQACLPACILRRGDPPPSFYWQPTHSTATARRGLHRGRCVDLPTLVIAFPFPKLAFGPSSSLSSRPFVRMVGASPYPSSSRMTSSRRPNRILLLVALFVFLVLFFTSYRSPAGYPSSYLSYSSSSTYSAPQQFDDLTLRPADRDERITLVAVYGNAKAATYLSPLLQTAAQNARSIDLLLVNVNQGGGCLDLSYVTDPASPTYAPNVKHLCLTEVENDEYYQRFICKGWKRGCDPETKATVMHHLERIRKEALKNGDEIFNTFKPCEWCTHGWPAQHILSSFCALCQHVQQARTLTTSSGYFTMSGTQGAASFTRNTSRRGGGDGSMQTSSSAISSTFSPRIS